MEIHNKVNDLDYRVVIVFGDVRSSLRNQTHKRLEKALVEGCKDIQQGFQVGDLLRQDNRGILHL
ncbi:hypothetical protein CN431_20170 [Bacillus cereus]|nr:hypothetical protein CN431_20170 [Bacillus cereus]